MMSREQKANREQIEIASIDEMVPANHLVRKIENAIDWNFIYEMVEESYSQDNGRPSLDPVVLIKLPILQYMFGIRSMRQTIREIEVNTAYRWFLGLGFHDSVPHFSTFGKNYTRRFQDTDLFEQIFKRILKECIDAGLVDESVVFVDSTHVKARANSKKYIDEIAREQALWYEKELIEEIQKDREAHGKKPLKNLVTATDEVTAEDKDDSDNNEPPKGSSAGKKNTNTSKKKLKKQKKEKHVKKSTSDPESGWFRKGEHKHVFAHSVQTACDINGIVLGYSVNPGNENDGRTFKSIYDKLKAFSIETLVADSGYKTPAIAKLLTDNNINLLSAYTRPKTKEGYFHKSEYVYDEKYDCYICPNDQILKYATTNRNGYREYKSCGSICAHCPYLAQCTASEKHEKVIERHVWADYVEQAEENRYTYGIRELYDYRKETIERIFGVAKEFHGFRFTQEYGKARMEVKAALTFACLNLKKLAKRRWKNRFLSCDLANFVDYFHKFCFVTYENPLMV